jgi:hypothetical protein
MKTQQIPFNLNILKYNNILGNIMKNIFATTLLAFALTNAFAENNHTTGNTGGSNAALSSASSFSASVSGASAGASNYSTLSNTGGNSQNTNTISGGVTTNNNSAGVSGGNSQNSISNIGNASLGVSVTDPVNLSTSTQINTTNNMPRIPVAQASAAPITASNGTCMGSSSGGAQGLGFGVSVASTWQDTGCDRRYNAQMLNQLGARDAALALMCQDAQVRLAMSKTSTPCVE